MVPRYPPTQFYEPGTVTIPGELRASLALASDWLKGSYKYIANPGVLLPVGTVHLTRTELGKALRRGPDGKCIAL